MPTLFSYRELFSVAVFHRFYRSFKSADLSFEPTAHCRRQLDRAGLVFRPVPGGFLVFGDVGANKKLKKNIPGDRRFGFIIRNLHPHFPNFTDLPLEQSIAQRFYFTNDTANPVDVFEQGTVHPVLHSGAKVAAGHLKELVQGVFRHEASGPGTRTFTLVRERNGNIMDSQSIEAVSGTFMYRNDMADFEPGCYHLEEDGATVRSFIYEPDASAGRCFGLLEIFIDVPLANRFLVNGENLSPKNFAIIFENRRTHWRYRAENRSGQNLPNPAIAVGNNASLFSHQGDLTFISNSTMELKEEPLKGIRLLRNANSLSSVVADDLANAGTSMIIPEQTNGDLKIYSDIFIYL